MVCSWIKETVLSNLSIHICLQNSLQTVNIGRGLGTTLWCPFSKHRVTLSLGPLRNPSPSL